MSGRARPIRLGRMELADIPQVVAIDQQSFPMPWSEATYRLELTENANSHFLVACLSSGARPSGQGWRGWLRREPPRVVVGYIGFWYVVDEAHISTLAVHPAYRGRGIGAQLLAAMLREAAGLGARLATLEVRVGNLAAQRLYLKFGFEEVGRRPAYYRDNAEDALLMTLAPLGRVWQSAADGRPAGPGESQARRVNR